MIFFLNSKTIQKRVNETLIEQIEKINLVFKKQHGLFQNA